MKDKTVLLILIDGLRHDYINPADSPFLSSLCDLNAHGAVRETFAFELRPAFLAGLHPEECGIANMFCFDPDGSPFKDIPIDDNDRVRISTDLRAEAKRRGYSLVEHIGWTHNIPLGLLKYLNFSEKYHTAQPGSIPGKKTVFDYLRDDYKEWLWIAYPEHSGKTKDVLSDFEKRYTGDEDFIYLHFSELDWAGHEYGPYSQETRGTLREIDEAIRLVYAALNRNHKELNSILFGDHGMVAVERHIDVEALLKESGLELEKDYIYFLDSTQARFWFKSGGAREKVERILKAVPQGRVLDDNDLERLRFRFEDNRFGELIFVVDGGVGIFPNFFQNKPCKGLHGYLPDVKANWGKLIVTGACAQGAFDKPVEMVELFPALLEMLGYKASGSTHGVGLFTPSQDAIDATVLLPTYNRLDILKKNLASLEAQNYPRGRFEVVVVDDGSIDSTAAYLDEFTKMTQLNFRHIVQGNSGPAAARNAGLRTAKGRVIVLIGDDMIPADDGFIDKHMRFHYEWPGLAHACLGLIEWSPNIELTPFMRHVTGEGGNQFCFDMIPLDRVDDIGFGFFWSSNVSFKRRFALSHGLFNDALFKHAMWEDIELGNRLEKAGMALHYRKGIVVHHEHELSLRGFVERQRMVGWYGHEMSMLGLPDMCKPDEYARAKIHSQKALAQMIAVVEALEEKASQGESLAAFYGYLLSYATALGYKGREGYNVDDADAVLSLLRDMVMAERRLAEKDAQLMAKDAAIAERDACIAVKDANIAERNANIAEKNAHITERDRVISDFLNSFSWRITAPIRRIAELIGRKGA